MEKKFNSFFAYVFSLIPGAGQMYLGLMNRGLQIMLVFWGILMFTSFLYILNFLNFILVIVWFYSFFDSYHIIKKLQSGVDVPDELLIDVNFNLLNKKFIGFGCIGIGLIILLDQFFDFINNIVHDYIFIRSVQNGILSIIFIGTGIYILYRLKKSENEETPDSLIKGDS